MSASKVGQKVVEGQIGALVDRQNVVRSITQQQVSQETLQRRLLSISVMAVSNSSTFTCHSTTFRLDSLTSQASWPSAFIASSVRQFLGAQSRNLARWRSVRTNSAERLSLVSRFWPRCMRNCCTKKSLLKCLLVTRAECKVTKFNTCATG